MRCFVFASVLSFLVSGARAEELVILSSSGDFKAYEGTASTLTLSSALDGANIWGVAANPESRFFYFTSPTTGEIFQLDWQAMPGSGLTSFISESGAVFHGAAVAGGSLYVLDSASDELWRYDLPIPGRKEVILGGFQRPNDVEVDLENERIYVTDSGADEVTVYSLVDQTLLATIPLQGAWGVAVHPGTGNAYFSSYDQGTISRYQWSNGIVEEVVAGLKGPRGLEFDRFYRLAVFESDENRLAEVDLATGLTEGKGYATDPKNGHAFVISDTNDFDGDFLGDSWEDQHASTLGELAPGMDPDADSIDVLAEYAFNGNPLAMDDLYLQQKWNDNVENVIEMDVVVDAGIATSFAVSNDLQTWLPLPPPNVTDSPVSGYLRYTFRFTSAEVYGQPQDRLFFRAGARADR